MTALALVPAAAFAQAANQNNLEASLKKPAAITNASTSTTSAPVATPGVATASGAVYHDVIKAALTSPEMDQAQAEGGVLEYTVFAAKDAKPEFAGPKLVSVVGRKLPLTEASTTKADVVVNLVVDNHGVPSEVKVARSAGSAAVDASTVEAVRQYRFKPATMNNLPAYAHVTMEIELAK
jgi:TonB family protein